MTTILVDPRAERDTGLPADQVTAFRHPIARVLIPLALLVLCGCGLKGDLYLPYNQTAGTPPAVVEDQAEPEEEDAG